MSKSEGGDCAAAQLKGLILVNGWKVVKRITPNENATGGTFSHSYLANKDGKSGFLKAFDFSSAFQAKNPVSVLKTWTTAYEHECEILNHCRERRLSRVVVALESGDVQVPGMDEMRGRVFYLIFELANGDVRGQVDESKRLDLLLTMRALKDTCLGLWQVHKEMIAHQDTKPSNVLFFENKGFRIADFGRASRKGHSVWYDKEAVAGDRNYAPPELLYGFTHPEFAARRFGCDLYMLGNLVAFMFGGVNITASLMSKLDPQFHWTQWRGTYKDVLPYVQQAFTRALEDLEPQIDPLVRAEVLPIVSQLCNPDMSRRGHPRNIGRHDHYSLERYVSQFERLIKQLQVSLRIGRKVA